MPWKLIFFITVMVIFVVFAGFNLENKTTISFGFASISDVPIFISLFFAFLLGILASIPIIFIQRRKIKKKYTQGQEPAEPYNNNNSEV